MSAPPPPPPHHQQHHQQAFQQRHKDSVRDTLQGALATFGQLPGLIHDATSREVRVWACNKLCCAGGGDACMQCIPGRSAAVAAAQLITYSTIPRLAPLRTQVAAAADATAAREAAHTRTQQVSAEDDRQPDPVRVTSAKVAAAQSVPRTRLVV